MTFSNVKSCNNAHSIKICLASLLLLLLAGDAYGNVSEPRSAQGTICSIQRRRCPLRIVPNLSSDVENASEVIVVKVKFQNDSDDVIYIRDESLADWPSLVPSLKPKNGGSYVSSSFISSRMPPARSKADFLKIDPHSFYQIDYSLILSEFNLENNGDYELNFRYNSPSSKLGSFGLRTWCTEDGQIESLSLLINLKR